MKEELGKVECQEYFEITLNVANSQVPISELIEYLRNTDKLIKGVNQTLNEKYAIGYNSISIDVIPFEEGSFRIPIWIKKVATNPILLAFTAAVFGDLLAVLLKNELGIHEIQTENEPIVVDVKTLLENKTTVDALCNIANLAIHNDSIRDVSVTYEKRGGGKENVTITKTVLRQLADYCMEDNPVSYLQTNVTLEIVSPVFSDEPSIWKVRYNGKIYSAKMKDEDFLQTMDAKDIAFGKGDTIVADFETEMTDVRTGGKPKYFIKKVIRFPRYTRISRNSVVQEDLFDDE